MIQLLDPVPFTIENDSHMGLSETQGLLSADGKCIVIDFRVADTVIGIVKTAAKKIRIPLADVQSIRFAKKYLGMAAYITIRTRNMRALETLPDAKMGAIAMKIARKDRAEAEEFCLALHEAIVRERGARINDEISGMLEGEEGN